MAILSQNEHPQSQPKKGALSPLLKPVANPTSPPPKPNTAPTKSLVEKPKLGEFEFVVCVLMIKFSYWTVVACPTKFCKVLT